MNYLKIFFGQMAILMTILGGIINVLENRLPIFIVQTFRYGKHACKKSTKGILKPIEVPKSWFKHFYVFSSIISSVSLYISIKTYIMKQSAPLWITNLLDIVAGTQRYASVTPAATLLAIILLTLQCYRRFYDTHFVSVYGKNVRINIIHYIVGFTHYAGAILAILCEAPKFSTTTANNLQLQFNDISYLHISGAVLFLWAWWHQYKATQILANLRKNVKGQVVSQKHHIPEGDLFTYVSSPHLLTEILMYIALTAILWQNSTWWFVTFWVVCNQVECALLTHWWYQETFPKYPPERKILIPFIF